MRNVLHIVVFTLLPFISAFGQANIPFQKSRFVDSLTLKIDEARLKIEEGNSVEGVQMYYDIITVCEGSKNEECLRALIIANIELSKKHAQENGFESANEHSGTALELAKQLDDKHLLYEGEKNRGEILSKFYEYNTDIDNNLTDESLHEITQHARSSFYNALNIVENFIKKKSCIAECQNSIGLTYIQEEKYYEAKTWFEKALKNINETEDETLSENIKLNLSFIYNEINNYNESILLSRELLTQIDSNDLGKRFNIHYNLAQSFDQLNRKDSALSNYKKAFELSEKNQKKVIDTEIAEVKEIHDNQSEELEWKMQAQADAQKNKLLTIILFTSLFIAIGAFFFVYNRHRYKQQNLQLTIIRNQQEAEIKAINAMVDGKEFERENIGRFLHHQVSSLLNSANLHLEVIASELSIDSPLFEKTQSILDDVSDQIRTLSHHLLSDVLVKFGLTVALDDLCERLSNPKIQFQFQTSIENQKRYNRTIENKLYGIAQELCNNVIKHSKATESGIRLDEIANNLVLSVSDNGIGFRKKNSGKGGVGLYQVRTRLRSIGGYMNIKSDGAKTTIKINIPLIIAEDEESSINQILKNETT